MNDPLIAVPPSQVGLLWQAAEDALRARGATDSQVHALARAWLKIIFGK